MAGSTGTGTDAGFGGGLGMVIGAQEANGHLSDARDTINNTVGEFHANSGDYNTFGKSFLDPATQAIGASQAKAGETQGYNQFMSGYTNTPAAQYQLEQANTVQNNSAAARGGLLAGSNLRQLATIDNGIVSQNANTAYDQYLKGNNQQFGQLQSVLGSMFSAIGVGETATGQQAGLDAAKLSATANLAGTQQKNDQQKGAGIGSMFSGLGSSAFMF